MIQQQWSQTENKLDDIYDQDIIRIQIGKFLNKNSYLSIYFWTTLSLFPRQLFLIKSAL